MSIVNNNNNNNNNIKSLSIISSKHPGANYVILTDTMLYYISGIY